MKRSKARSLVFGLSLGCETLSRSGADHILVLSFHDPPTFDRCALVAAGQTSESPILRANSEGDANLIDLKPDILVAGGKHRYSITWKDNVRSKVTRNWGWSIMFVLSFVVSAWGLYWAWNRATSGRVTSLCEGNWADCETTAPFIFDSIHALTKQWPSTYAPNGHSILTVVLPKGIQLYHAKRFTEEVKIPIWLSFDPCVQSNGLMHLSH